MGSLAPLTVADVLAASPLPPLDGPDAIADQLVTVAHRCVDWDVWGGARTIRYWDSFVDRVRASCYAGPTLADWWGRLTTQMSLHAPHTDSDRELLGRLLACGDDAAVLSVLRGRADMLVLRLRVANEALKSERGDVA